MIVVINNYSLDIFPADIFSRIFFPTPIIRSDHSRESYNIYIYIVHNGKLHRYTVLYMILIRNYLNKDVKSK